MTETQLPGSPASPKKSPGLALLLSLIFPGLGHLYLGSLFRGLSYFAMGAGVLFVYFSAHSYLSKLAILFIFPFIWFPAARDAIAVAKGKQKAVTGDESRIYVIWMMCCVGPFALPLLWQNKKFSTPVKVIWTLLVIGIVAGFIVLMKSFGSLYDQLSQAAS